MQPDDNSIKIAKLTWACRRGMLELDVLLGNFLKEAYSNLAPADQTLFEDLLQCTDPELFRWLLGSEIPEAEKIKKITDMIRHHARTRIQS